MARKTRRTAKQRAASRRNLEIARRMKKRGTKRKFAKAYKFQRKTGMPKSIARNVAWGMVRHK
jgi:hypothetical protein